MIKNNIPTISILVLSAQKKYLLVLIEIFMSLITN